MTVGSRSNISRRSDVTADVAPARAESATNNPPFHTLNVAAVESLCDDAAAITFDVPAELRGAFDFAAGQSVTVRRTVQGRGERRDYSICAPVGALPRIRVRKIHAGLFSYLLFEGESDTPSIY